MNFSAETSHESANFLLVY